MKRLLFYCQLIFLFYACAPRFRSAIYAKQEPFEDYEYVLILQKNENFVNDGVTIGEICVGDHGLSVNCSYEESVGRLRQLARQNGANVIKITEFKPSDFKSACDRIKAKLYRVSDARKHENTIEWTKSRRLRWDDFKGLPQDMYRSGVVAETGSGFSLKTNPVALFKKPKFFVKTIFDCNSSWVSPEQNTNDYVLGHEQLHFDLAELYARQLRKELVESSITYSRLGNAELSYKNVKALFVDRQKLYDSETNHGQDRRKQANWRKMIDKELLDSESYAQH